MALWFGGHAGQAGGRYVEVVLVLFNADELVAQLQRRHTRSEERRVGKECRL